MSALFSPLKLGRYELNHRVVLAPMTRYRSGKEDAVPSDLSVAFYGQRATEGGLLITEATSITRAAGVTPGAPGIFSPEQIAGWKRVTDAVHAKGGIIFSQIWHQGRAAKAAESGGQQVVSASAIAITGPHIMGGEHELPHELTIPEIEAIIQDFVQAAKNAIEAGFDGIELHAANGYLLDQFINSSSNKRTDIYGEDRGRLIVEVVNAVADAIGGDRVGIRFSPFSGFQDMLDDTPFETWGSILERISGVASYVHFCEPKTNLALDYWPEQAESIDRFREMWKQAPFISAGGYTYDPKIAYDIAEKKGGLTAFGRAFIANPDLVERIRNGWTFNKYDRNTFYSNGAEGYSDYPFYKQ